MHRRILILGTALVVAATVPVAVGAAMTERVSVSTTGEEADGASNYSALSADGRYVAFSSSATNLVSGDTNGVDDIFVHDRKTGKTTRVSVSSAGEQGNGASIWPALGADGRFVAFRSAATNLVSGDTNRSRADLAAVGEMVRAGWQDQKIFAAFACDEWPIGERFRELYLRE